MTELKKTIPGSSLFSMEEGKKRMFVASDFADVKLYKKDKAGDSSSNGMTGMQICSVRPNKGIALPYE